MISKTTEVILALLFFHGTSAPTYLRAQGTYENETLVYKSLCTFEEYYLRPSPNKQMD